MIFKGMGFGRTYVSKVGSDGRSSNMGSLEGPVFGSFLGLTIAVFVHDLMLKGITP